MVPHPVFCIFVADCSATLKVYAGTRLEESQLFTLVTKNVGDICI